MSKYILEGNGSATQKFFNNIGTNAGMRNPSEEK